MANAERLQQTLEHIKANPEDWDQRRWNMCFAGWTVRLASEATIRTGECGCCSTLVKEGGGIIPTWEIHQSASRLLDVDRESELFDANNTLEDLERIVQDLIAEALLSA